MDLSLSAINEIRPESDRYLDKALQGWQATQDTGAGTKRCCVPDMRYLGSGSEEKVLMRRIARIFCNIGAQYTVGKFV